MKKNLIERDSQVIWHPYTQMMTTTSPVGIVMGEGAYIFDEEGKKYIDAISSWWVTLHGHGHPYIAKKVSEQLLKLEHVIFAGFTHEPAVRLAERLLEVLPENQARIFYSDNGSTAVEVALKMAYQFWHNKGEAKTKIVAFKNAYHGDTFGAMSVSGRSAFTNPFLPFLFDVIHIDVPVKGKEKEALQQLKNVCSENDAAAFIFEPLVQGAAGMVMYDPEALNDLVKVCKEYNVLAIADEVMTGFYRTGRYFACNYIQEMPDIMCLSKGLTGGTMAMGVTSCTSSIYEAFLSEDHSKTFFHGHSYTANPLACVAALASMDLLHEADTLSKIKMIEKHHVAFIEKVAALDILKNICHRGTILAIELKTDDESGYFNSIKEKAYSYFMERNILLRPLGNVIYIFPPYCISAEDLKMVHKVIADFLNILEAAK